MDTEGHLRRMDTVTTTITWDRDLLEKFRKLYTRAVNAGHDEFTFQDHVIVVGYAKYLIEYLDTRLSDQ